MNVANVANIPQSHSFFVICRRAYVINNDVTSYIFIKENIEVMMRGSLTKTNSKHSTRSRSKNNN